MAERAGLDLHPMVTAKSGDFAVGAADNGKVFDVTATSGVVTAAPAAASTLGNGFHFYVRRHPSSTQNLVIDPNASETIDGAATRTLKGAGDVLEVISDGANWVTTKQLSFDQTAIFQKVSGEIWRSEPEDSANGDFNFVEEKFANPDDGTRDNNAWGLGYNVHSGGGRDIASQHAMGIIVESYYAPSPGVRKAELHWVFVKSDGTQRRFMSATAGLTGDSIAGEIEVTFGAKNLRVQDTALTKQLWKVQDNGEWLIGDDGVQNVFLAHNYNNQPFLKAKDSGGVFREIYRLDNNDINRFGVDNNTQGTLINKRLSIGGDGNDATTLWRGGTNILTLFNGTAPGTGSGDLTMLYSADRVAGEAGLRVKDETAAVIHLGKISQLHKGTDVASAATITPTGQLFHVTGTTNIDNISATGITAGTFLALIFDGVLTVNDGTGNLKLQGNFVTQAEDVLLVYYDGTSWFEVCRNRIVGGGYTDEMAQDAVGGILVDSATIDFAYNDGAPSITAIVIDDSITFAKMQNINTARLIGRTTAAAGDPEEISVGAPLTLSGGVLDFDETAALGNNARVTVRKNTGADVGARRRLNLIEGANITLTVTDDSISEEVDITVAGTVNTGTAELDFGAFPGKSDASVEVTGQAAIAAGSIVQAWLRPVATSDHTADEHMLETLAVFAGNIVAGTGFTIYGFNRSERNEALEPGGEGRAATTVVGAQSGDGMPRKGGIGTRLWGKWTVAWRWS